MEKNRKPLKAPLVILKGKDFARKTDSFVPSRHFQAQIDQGKRKSY
jgi:hypothetical protein